MNRALLSALAHDRRARQRRRWWHRICAEHVVAVGSLALMFVVTVLVR